MLYKPQTFRLSQLETMIQSVSSGILSFIAMSTVLLQSWISGNITLTTIVDSIVVNPDRVVDLAIAAFVSSIVGVVMPMFVKEVVLIIKRICKPIVNKYSKWLQK